MNFDGRSPWHELRDNALLLAILLLSRGCIHGSVASRLCSPSFLSLRHDQMAMWEC